MKYNLKAELKWVFLSNGNITLTEAIRLLNKRVNDTVDRDEFTQAVKELYGERFIIDDINKKYRVRKGLK